MLTSERSFLRDYKASAAVLADTKTKLKKIRAEMDAFKKEDVKQYLLKTQECFEVVMQTNSFLMKNFMSREYDIAVLKLDLEIKARKIAAREREIAHLRGQIDILGALVEWDSEPDSVPVDPSRVADILSAAGGGQAADE
jgi:hypothetical protein